MSISRATTAWFKRRSHILEHLDNLPPFSKIEIKSDAQFVFTKTGLDSWTCTNVLGAYHLGEMKNGQLMATIAVDRLVQDVEGIE
jgi:hypothetical protein